MYIGFVEVSEKKVQEIFDRLNKAQEEIYSCYDELKEIGIVKMIPADAEQKEILEKLSWGMQHEEGSRDVDVFPMNGEKIVIHGKQEAEFFCKMLTEYFQ